MVYLASPIDRADPYDRRHVKMMLQELGFTVYDPSGAWTAQKPYDSRIREMDLDAIARADGVYVLWPEGTQSIGVPMEIQHALEYGLPVVAVMGDYLQAGSAMLQMAKGASFAAYRWSETQEAALWLRAQIQRFAAVQANDAQAFVGPSQSIPLEYATFPTRAIDATLTIQSLIGRVGAYMREKGWLDDGRTFGDDIALMHTELSEALEEFRSGHMPDEQYHTQSGLVRPCPECHTESFFGEHDEVTRCSNGHAAQWKDQKPEGVPSELADLMIRIAGACNQWDIALESALQKKLDYNDTRAKRHGGKKL